MERTPPPGLRRCPSCNEPLAEGARECACGWPRRRPPVAATASSPAVPRLALAGLFVLLIGLPLGSQVVGWLTPVEPLPDSEPGDSCTASFECRGEYRICSRGRSDAEGYCTRACREDPECPGDMTCSTVFVEYGSTVRVCGY